MSSYAPVFITTRWGDIPKLTYANYDYWKDDIILIISAMRAYAIVTGDDPELRLVDFKNHDNKDDWKARKAEATSMIRLSCSPEVRHIGKGMRYPLKMWKTLESSLDTAASYISTQNTFRQFGAYWPKDNEHLEAYFTKRSNYRMQLHNTNNAITDRDFRTQILHYCHHSMWWHQWS